MTQSTVSLVPRIHEIIANILLQHPEIDLCKIKKAGQSFDIICQLLTEECRRPFTITLLTLFVTYYYPVPDNFKERLDKLDQCVLDRLIIDAWSNSSSAKRDVLAQLLTEEELAPTTLGYALRIGEYPETSFHLSTCQVTDYSVDTLARTILRQAKTSSERKYAKEMILRSIQEELALQLIFVPLDTLCDELLLIDAPCDLTDNYRYDFVCPLSGRHVYLDLPDCYRLTPIGCSKISLFIAADCALSCFLWQWLCLSTCPQYNLLITSINLDQAKSLLNHQHCIDVFLCSYHYLVKEVIGECLLSKYVLAFQTSSSLDTNLFTTLYQADQENIRNLMAECLLEFGYVNCDLLKEKIKLHLKARPDLKQTLLKKQLALTL